MPKKVTITKTLNPLHFEDLEPRRFEDLVRRLLYSFRDWRHIEPTGRGGSDDGFDIRAWEKTDQVTNEDEDGVEGVKATEGRMWQIQAKREKIITAKKVRAIVVANIDTTDPPYGYVLAAAANPTKKTLDALRETARSLGVREVYFWGKDYLEDQLALPQNDEILFTFFGLSLSPKRRSRITEIKFGLNNKNKVQKLVFGSESVQADIHTPQRFLLRDIKDSHYPDAKQYPDFDKKRRWEEHDAVHLTPRGVHFKIRERYAYWDRKTGQWDITDAVDLVGRTHNIDASNRARLDDTGKTVERFWRELPRRVQAKLVVFGFLPFEDILLIDDKGDSEFGCPQIFVDFGETGPFSYITANLRQHHTVIGGDEIRNEQRISVFPKAFAKAAPRRVHKIADLSLPASAVAQLNRRWIETIYLFQDASKGLKQGDVIHVPKATGNDSERHLAVTNVRTAIVSELLKELGEPIDHHKKVLETSAGRDVKAREQVTILELHTGFMVSEEGPFIYSQEADR